MGVELEPRTYDERIRTSDAQRRCRKELKDGTGRLSAAYFPQHSVRSGNTYRTVQTVLVVDGKVVMYFRYRRDGRVQGVSWVADRAELTDKYEPCLPDAAEGSGASGVL